MVHENKYVIKKFCLNNNDIKTATKINRNKTELLVAVLLISEGFLSQAASCKTQK